MLAVAPQSESRTQFGGMAWRSIAALPVGCVLALSLAVNLAWLPVPLDWALLLVVLGFIPIWSAVTLFCFWCPSPARLWSLLALAGVASMLLNLAGLHAG